MAKDLYYIFDILVNFKGSIGNLYEEIKNLKQKYTVWFGTFIKNLGSDFIDVTSRGVQLVHEQRQSNAFPSLNEEQFKQYVLSVFGELIINVR